MSDLPPETGAPESEPTEPAPPRPHDSFRSHLLRALPLIAGVTILTSVLAHFGFLRSFETAALDSYLRLKPPLRSEHVVIVAIDECDYTEIFRATSPLDPDALSRLLAAIAAGRPRLIAVDLDTSHPRFRGFRTPAEVPLVWARGANSGSDQAMGACAPVRGEHAEGDLAPGFVLGGPPPPGLPSGIAVLPRDSDGIVRRTYRDIETSEGALPTFPWAVVREIGGDGAKAGHGEALVLNFAGDRFAFPRMSAGDVLRVAGSEGWSAAGPLRDRIVIVGGSYRAARDEYMTPVGPMSGAELVAQAIESELEGGGIRPANEIVMVLLEIVGGVLLVWIHHWLRVGVALVISLVAIPLLAGAFSYLAFSSVALWANFIPIFVAVLLHQLYDHARAYRALYLRERVRTTGR